MHRARFWLMWQKNIIIKRSDLKEKRGIGKNRGIGKEGEGQRSWWKQNKRQECLYPSHLSVALFEKDSSGHTDSWMMPLPSLTHIPVICVTDNVGEETKQDRALLLQLADILFPSECASLVEREVTKLGGCADLLHRAAHSFPTAWTTFSLSMKDWQTQTWQWMGCDHQPMSGLSSGDSHQPLLSLLAAC